LNYGIHGPASLIGSKSIKKFKLNRLRKLKGAVPWDSWLEPLVKTGFMVTSNVSRYRDNGHNGTHASVQNDSHYFQRVNESFNYGLTESVKEYHNSDMEHHWRSDCRIYNSEGKINRYFRFLALRLYQIFRAFL
jgi:hypothetical protein